MAPQSRSLQQIRRQVAANRKSTASVTNHSAFTHIEQKNERFVHGRAIHRPDPEELPRVSPQKVTKRQAKRTSRSRSRPVVKASEPEEPMDEYWRFAGGDRLDSNDEDASTLPTRIVGIARVPTWMLDALKTIVKEAIEEYGEVQDLVTQQVKDGAEDCADLYAVFRSELVAEVVRDALDGKLVEGRKVQVRYA